MRFIIVLLFVLLAWCTSGLAQTYPVCYTNDVQLPPSSLRLETATTLGIMKSIRINVHYMLKTNGTGNFRETDDGDGRSTYNGYMYANELTDWLNATCSFNQQMNLPPGNTTPMNTKNYSFKLDAVYFWRNDADYNYQALNDTKYATLGKDKDSVLNIFLSYATATDARPSGYALYLSATSKTKYTENQMYWQEYKFNLANGYPWGSFMHTTGVNTSHELGHLLGLSHTVLWNNAPPCPTGCSGSGPINTSCDDGCADTPTAWAITSTNGCIKHPGDCGWNPGTWCSNNLMDYSGHFALTPCQLDKIHSSLEGGMKSYLSCAAVAKDLTLCDIGYPKVGYFGKKVSIGCTSTMATVANNEKIKVYYSDSVELTNFEASSNSEIEFFKEDVCSF